MSQHKKCPCGGLPELITGKYPYSGQEIGVGIRCTERDCLWTNGVDEGGYDITCYYPTAEAAWAAWDTRAEGETHEAI